MKNFFTNATTVTRTIINERLKEGSIAIDATVGNGHDTLLMAQLIGKTGKVTGFDIQEEAIKKTKVRLEESNLLENVKLIKDDHASMDKYISTDVDMIIFNLGYLPGGDHSIVTKSHSTIKAIEESLNLLKVGGTLLVTVYPGHEEGLKEKNSIEIFFKSLDQRKFTVLKFDFFNQINNPPIVFGVEKIK